MKTSPVPKLCEEPFRVFFPLAVLATIGGVSLWPLFHFDVLAFYPNVAHARVMTVALAGFLAGFLGTAFPRLIDASPFRPVELVLLLVLWLSALVCHFLNRAKVGDGLFAVTMVTLAMCLAARWVFFGKDTPPPGGPVALLGVLSGGAAAAALAWGHGMWMSPAGYSFATLVLYQATPLLPLLGVGPYLLPRLFGHPSPHRLGDSPTPPPGWWPRFLACAACGLAVLFSLGLEAAGWPRAGMLLRAVAVIAFFVSETPIFRRARELTTPGTVVRCSVGAIVLGFAWAAFDPARRVGILHLFFVSGIGMVMLGVGARVVLGHAGRHDLLAKRMIWLRVVIGLVLVAAVSRVTADYLPRIRFTHLDYAAATWIAVALLWLGKLGRFFLADEDDEQPSRCPKARQRTGETGASTDS